jgi:hypothetical protein
LKAFHARGENCVTRLIGMFAFCILFLGNKDDLTSLEGFPHQPSREVIKIAI